MDPQEEEQMDFLAGLIVVAGVLYQLCAGRRASRIWNGTITASRPAHGAFKTTIPNLLADDPQKIDDIGMLLSLFYLSSSSSSK